MSTPGKKRGGRPQRDRERPRGDSRPSARGPQQSLGRGQYSQEYDEESRHTTVQDSRSRQDEHRYRPRQPRQANGSDREEPNESSVVQGRPDREQRSGRRGQRARHGTDHPQHWESGRGGPSKSRGGDGGAGIGEAGSRSDHMHQSKVSQHQERQVAETYPRGRVKFLSWKEISDLAKSTSEQVVKTILGNEAGFLNVFTHPESCGKSWVLKSLIKIIYLLVRSQEKGLASRVLGQVFCGDGNCAQFCFQVEKLLRNMPVEKNSEVRKENQNYLLYLLEIGLFGIKRVQKTMHDTFPKATLINTVDTLKSSGEDVRILQTKCEELKKQFELVQEEIKCLQIPTKQVDCLEDLEPPDNFTHIEVLPQNNDLKCGPNFKPFLRPNIIKGKYRDWDHYLDVQFRLLREDFISPLRDGIKSQYEGLTHRIAEVRVYEHVQILTPVCLFTGIGFQISFDTKRFQHTNWEHSRRLIFGSLLCLSKNDFSDDSVIFATVVKRDPEQLKEGYLMIKFEDDSGFRIDPTDKYTMVESTAYFEAYRHILLGLQNASQVQDTMPFKRYIVECTMDDISPPLHIRATGSTCFNLSKALGTKTTSIKITDASTWPHFRETRLDKSQYEAMKMALRQEISVIQGPPGTGKTFIGLKLVQVFLENRKAWDPQCNSSILLVCYTNHALDQFLEEIVDEYKKDAQRKPPDIVRIGGRCKNEKLSNFVLATKVLAVRSERSVPVPLHKRNIKARDEMNALKAHFAGLLNPAEGKLLPLSLLANVIPDLHYMQITQGMPTEPGREIEVWLSLWHPSEIELANEKPDIQEEQEPGLSENIDEGAVAQNENSPEDNFIAVDEEARILQDDRMLEGEEIVNDFGEKPVTIHRAEVNDGGKRKAASSYWQTVQISEKERNRKIKGGFKQKPMDEENAQGIEDIRLLSENERWQLYHYWISQYLKLQKLSLQGHADQYNEACRVYTETKQEIDCHVARGADIIGMTTTGAAKHHHLLKKIHPKIVIIEEAAEVFESHVITSLSPSVQQLILIGDHKQLRPKPNCYKLEKDYNIAVSLFERLINNDIPHVTLEVQHRMRPEIASLICPAIYPNLENGKMALKHDEHKIGGIGRNVFFIDHTFPEKRQDPHESLSHVNIHEASYMVSLCHYLLKQGYKQTQITLLTMYRGQLLEMKRRMKRTVFDGVRVAAVDDFQGEENDIILLSLVRSNSDGNIGFLKIENRVCVSLSRARKGLYVIGNFSMVRGSEKSIWPKILSVVDEKGCIGEALPLQCQIHPTEIVLARIPEDFSKCPEGGCRKVCDFRHKCGHRCSRVCHPWDRDHKSYRCEIECNKILPCRHKCKRKCYECTGKCAPCLEMVPKRIPKCGHRMTVFCHQAPNTIECIQQCKKILSCGHLCQERCSDPCSPQCYVTIPKKLPCGHSAKVQCYLKPENVVCPTPCGTLLQCLHPCEGTCGSCHQGRLHVRCRFKCGRNLVCGHICSFPCPAECPPCLQACKNYCIHSRCPKKCYEPCDPCAEQCQWSCIHLKCTRKCGELCDRPPCNEPCLKALRCGHPCIGLCGEKCPKLCRICNRNEVVEIFFGTEDDPDATFVQLEDCGHVLEYSGLDHWMEESTNDDPNEIMLKKCPKCRTLIRKSLRYFNQIKKVHNDFEKIKKMQLEASKDTPALLTKLLGIKDKIVKLKNCEEVMVDLKNIELVLSPASRPHFILPHRLSAIQNQINMLPNLAKLYAGLAQVQYKECQFSDCKVTVEIINQEIECAQTFLMQDCLTDQQLKDFECEIQRLQCMFRLFELYSRVKVKKVTLLPEDNDQLNVLASTIYRSGVGDVPKLSVELEQQVSQLIAHFNKQYKVDGLTEAERTDIVKAIGLSKGHWFKCPNGHIYCIGECGGATEEARCPDCGATIGGVSHRLRDDNQLAPEMDGARHSAWPAAANLDDYDPNDMQRLAM